MQGLAGSTLVASTGLVIKRHLHRHLPGVRSSPSPISSVAVLVCRLCAGHVMTREYRLVRKRVMAVVVLEEVSTPGDHDPVKRAAAESLH